MSRHMKSSDRVLPISPKIDLDEIRRDIEHLKAHRDLTINELKGETSQKYKSIAEKLDLLHGTKHYSKFVGVIIEVFHDVKVYRPNTVGAYLNGCNVHNNLEFPNVCNAICAGSIPSFEEGRNDSFDSSMNSSLGSVSGRNSCDYLVMQMNWDQSTQSFTFVDLNNNSQNGSGKCYLYTTFNKADWPGFSELECKAFKDYGIKKVMIYHIDDTGSKYTPITEEWTKIDKLTIREHNKHGHKKHCGSNCGDNNGPDNGNGNGGNGSSSNNTAAWVVFAIILILLLIIIAWAISSKRD